jgi:hypothetical protein
MAERSTIIHLVTRVGIFFAALFLVGVLLAAIPAHKQPAPEPAPSQEPVISQSSPANNSSLPNK